MRIAIDASSAAVPRRTGVAKYIHRLIEHLEELDDENDYFVYHRLSRWKNRNHFYRPRKAGTVIRQFQEPFFRGRNIDVFHGPDARLPKIRGPKLIATVHDLLSLVSDEFAEETFRKRKIAQYEDTVRRADRIICVSESTRRDLLRFFPEAEPKTCVIYEGIDDEFYPRSDAEIERVRKKYGIESDYILYVGALSKRKNILRMFEAFRRVCAGGETNLQFIAAGRLTYGKQEILDYVTENRCGDQIMLTGYVPEEDLPALYSGARLFLFTTLYEGFGLPILEALACGTPVVTSNISAMSEIAGDAALLADPEKVEEIEGCIRKGLIQGLGSDESMSAIRDWTKRFSWKKAALETLGEYRQ